MVNITLKQCTYFVTVADMGGIAQAARSLNISQPAVAQALEKLESICNLRLFVRHHARGTELTPQGRAFYASARDLLLQAERTDSDAKAIAADLAGTIRFACFHTLAPFYLSRIIKTHRHRYPKVIVQASELLQDELLAAVSAGEVDLALTYDLELEGYPLEKQLVTRLKPFIVLSQSHPLAKRRSIKLTEMAHEPFVMFDGSSSRNYFDQLLTRQGIQPPIGFHSKSMESVRCAVANGLGFSLSVMKTQHTQTYDGGEVVFIPIQGKVEPISIVLIRNTAKYSSTLIDRFMDSCKTPFEDTL